MKILMLFPYAPLPPPMDLAGTKRNLPFLLELVKYHEVSVLSYGTAEEELTFRLAYGDLCSKVRFVNRKQPRIFTALERASYLLTGRSDFRTLYRKSFQRAINEMVIETSCDLIHCCTQFFGYFEFPKDVPISSDTHEVKYDLLLRIGAQSRNPIVKAVINSASKLGKPEEIKLCQSFDLLISTTARDQVVFQENILHPPIKVIENGAGDSFFQEHSAEEERVSMVFTGLFSHPPNRQGMRWFLNEVFPLVKEQEPDARVYVIGKNPPKDILARNAEDIVVTGFVNDVRPFMARSAVFIIPLKAGGGIRGKALEAMAMKKAIVTTGIGVEGIHLSHEHSALIADTKESFAHAILSLFHKKHLREKLSNAAYHIACKEYRWTVKGQVLSDALTELISRKNSANSFNTLRSVVH